MLLHFENRVKERERWNQSLPMNNIICARNSQAHCIFRAKRVIKYQPLDSDDRKTQTIIIAKTALLKKMFTRVTFSGLSGMHFLWHLWLQCVIWREILIVNKTRKEEIIFVSL